VKGALVALWFALAGSMALAEEPTIPECGPVGEMRAVLASKWGESPVVMGTSGDALFTWFANPSTGTWTATVVDSTGQLCILTSGDGHSVVPNV
jgi:hypothetical protein